MCNAAETLKMLRTSTSQSVWEFQSALSANVVLPCSEHSCQLFHTDFRDRKPHPLFCTTHPTTELLAIPSKFLVL